MFEFYTKWYAFCSTTHKNNVLSNWEEKSLFWSCITALYLEQLDKNMTRVTSLYIHKTTMRTMTATQFTQCKITDKIYHCQWSCTPIRWIGTNGRSSFLCYIPRTSSFMRCIIAACSTFAIRLHCWLNTQLQASLWWTGFASYSRRSMSRQILMKQNVFFLTF